MILYKYLSSNRIDILLNCKIRHTQFGDFNDPYELNPNIDRIAEKEEINRLAKTDLPRLIEQEYDKYPIIHTLISKAKFLELAQAQEDIFAQSIIALQPTISKLLQSSFQNVFNQNIGALSLSEDPKNNLMWSHYAEEHKGYVLGFYSGHPYFNQKKSPSDELRHLRKVVYSKERPKINLMNTNGVDIFLSKGINWQYESEWRIIRPFTEATEVIDKQPYPIYLFSFPSNIISEIILGYRMSKENIKTIRQLLTNDAKYSHVKLYQAQLNEMDFSINFE